MNRCSVFYLSGMHLLKTDSSPRELALNVRPDQQRVVIVGDANCGKSVLTYNLFKALRSMDVEEYPYVLAVTVDGEGRGTHWFPETMKTSPELGLALKELNNGHYSEAHFDFLADEVAAQNERAVLILPIGGVRDSANLGAAALGNRAVIVHRDTGDLAQWRSFCREAGLEILAEVWSELEGEDKLHSAPNEFPLRITAAGLERGADVSDNLAIQGLAREIVTSYRGLRPAPVLLEEASLPRFEPTYLVQIESQFQRSEDEQWVSVVKVGFNQIYKDVAGDELLRDACNGFDRIREYLPSQGIVFFDGPATTPIAVALSLRAANSDTLVAWRTREGDFVSVSQSTLNGAIVPYGSSLDPSGNLKAPQTLSQEYPFERFDFSTVVDHQDPPQRGALLEVQLRPGFGVPQIMQACVEQLDEMRESLSPAGTLYISGALPIAVTSLLAEKLQDKFEQVANFVPNEGQYLCNKSSDGVSQIWLPPPQPVSVFSELLSQAVEANEADNIDGRRLTLVTASLNRDLPAETAVLAGNLARELQVPQDTDGVYVNGRLPLVASVVVASLFQKRNPSVWIANFVPSTLNYLVAHHEQDDSVGRYIGGPKLVSERSLLQVYFDDLEKKSPLVPVERQELFSFLAAVLGNEEKLSRTLSGIYDTSVSDDKPPLILSGHSLAQKATGNLLAAYVLVKDCAKQTYTSPEELKDLFFEVYDLTQRDLLSVSNRLWRTWDPAYVSVKAEQVEPALDKFIVEYYDRLDRGNVLANYSWTLRTLDRDIHPLADGVGRMSRLMAMLHLLRHDHPLPQFPSRDEYYQAMEQGPVVFDAFVEHCPRLTLDNNC